MTDSTSPAIAAYEEVSPLRDRHAPVIWGSKDASPADLREILNDLDAGLEKLSTPLNSDLAEGNVFLRYRRFNFLIDKIIVLDRLEDPLAAVRAWEQLEQMEWDDLTKFAQGALADRFGAIGERFRRLLERPEAAGIRAQLAVLARCNSGETLASRYRDSLPIEERIAGLSRIWSAARDAFVWFDHVPDLDWDRAYLDAIPRVMAAPEIESYYRELMRFVALLHDAHSNVYPPKELAPRFYSRPGVRTAKVEGSVLVMDVTDADLARQGLRRGDEILAIDGVDVERYAQERVAPYQSSSTEQDRQVRTFSYALLAGTSERTVVLGVRDPGGTQRTLTAQRAGYRSTAGSTVERSSAPFALREDGVAVLRATQFENRAAADLLGEHIREVMSAKGLILDLRGNGGGSTHCGLQLLSWLSDAPLPSMASTYRENDALARARSGDRARIAWRNLERPEISIARDPVFRGAVAMLIDARTFSAAEDTVAVFKLMRRGVIVGTASGGSTGQPWLFDLPGGGRARICVKRDAYPDGTTFVGTGIIPDIEAPPTVDDVRADRDAALERAAQELAAV